MLNTRDEQHTLSHVAPALASLAARVVLAAVAAAAAPLGVVDAMYAGQIVAAVAGL